MSASEHLSPTQFSRVPLTQVHGFSLDNDEDGAWAEEHGAEYKQHGGWQGYVTHLAQDMKRHGQQEPVQLRHEGEGNYSIWDGNHRVAAAREAGLTHITARLL